MAQEGLVDMKPILHILGEFPDIPITFLLVSFTRSLNFNDEKKRDDLFSKMAG